MSLEGIQPIPAASDNLKEIGPASGNSAGLDNFIATTWSNSQSFRASEPIAQLFELPGQSAQPEPLAIVMDKGFTGQDVISVIKDQVGQGDETKALDRNVSNIKVVYTDGNSTESSTADFKIDQDGKLIMPANKALLDKKDLVIEVERPDGYVGAPLEDQQKSLNELVKGLADNVLDKHGKVEDPQGLIPESIKNLFKVKPEPEAHFPQAMQQAMHNMQRFAGGGQGQMSPSEASEYFPARQVERQENESDAQAALKDAIAGFATTGDANPYFAVRNFGERGAGIGRYMFTSELLLEWLEDLFSGCGNPPDANKVLAKLLKTMKNKGLAAKCAKTLADAAKSGELKGFLHDLKSGKLKPGDPATMAAIEKFMPKELQETVASQLIDKLSNSGSDPSKIAMHMLIGHEPSAKEMAKPEYKQLLDSFERLNAISHAHTSHPTEAIKWEDKGGKLECAPLSGRITDHFGHRDHHPVTGGHAMHNGVDIVLNNDKIPALMSGTVVKAGYAGAAGNRLEIDHGNGVKTVYMHLKNNLPVGIGDHVSKGQLIGYQGATGRVTGKHLHLGLYVNGQAKDPMKYLNIRT
ncbi:MAG: M23 family metallopeptidase [Candidatus Obscuribacterales bacterium]|nr:M23 family metallopeptidase [Candidatus Obscuribacterales bacterium]